ncbi:MAG: AAA family ATPase [Gammaproteobacteria bacterium]|nr:AAA family ATPase [Gammaproteobacteria bacterium]
MPSDYPRIPYGWADYAAIRQEGRMYVDKTRHLRALEEERYAVLIRPRRFGKSCWVSLMECYYDRNRADAFDALFGDTDIGRKPTRRRNRYVILRFDFSAVSDVLETLEREFETYCESELRDALESNPDVFSENAAKRILAPPSIEAKLNELFRHTRRNSIPLYVLIDEYDNFANTILAHRGAGAYQSLTHHGGFYRNFFAALKAGAGRGSGMERLFVTGVSPITLDDLTSGFNIGRNLSLRPEFNDLLGFTELEVRRMLAMYRDFGVFDQDIDDALGFIRDWYGGYRFAKDAPTEIFNTDMVLYFLDESMPNKPPPDNPIDDNVRIDYGKLRHLLVVDQGRPANTADNALNGNFHLLRHLIGENSIDGDVQSSFPLDRLDRRENFLSLLYYFGLLGIRGASEATAHLGIPNQTVKRLMYGYLRDAYDDVGVFSADPLALSRLTHEMAHRGQWRPVLDFLRDAIARQTGIRDYIDGEKVVQAFLAAHFSLTTHFLLHSEQELNKGHADLYLEPFVARFPDIAFGYVIEIKYLHRRDKLGDTVLDSRLSEAAAQLRQYLADETLQQRYPSIQHIGLALVFHGWELATYKEVRL